MIVRRLPPVLRRPGLWAGVLVVGALALTAPEIITGTFSDLDTFVRVAALAAVVAGWVIGVRRVVDRPLPRAGLVWLPIAVVLGVIVWPYLRPATEVDEAFPPVSAAPTTTTVRAVVTTTTAPATTSAPPTTVSSTTTAPPEPVELRRASFQGLTGHRGSGDAAVYRLADDSILLRFEAVDIGSGPDLEVYLVPGEDRRGLTDGIHVAPLTAERGNQNYTVPPDVDLTDGTWTVLVWCETFSVEVANATLA